MDGLTTGRIVHYVIEAGKSEGEHRPAIVVNTWKSMENRVNLQVFVDGGNDALEDGHTVWRTSIAYDENKATGTWHWIEKA